MNRKTIALCFVIAAMSMLALPAAAFTYLESCNGSGVRWDANTPTFRFSRTDFPSGSQWEAAIEAARAGWNNHAPGSYWYMHSAYTTNVTGISGDGYNDVRIASAGQWQWPGYAAITLHQRTFCAFFPGAGSHYTEADILISPSEQFDLSTKPVPSDYMKSGALMLLHEFGHAGGLGHEDGVLATMNSGWPGPVGGPVGAKNDVQPLGDDVRGMRNAYGTLYTTRDVAGSAVRLVSPGVSRTIPAPASTDRSKALSFQFTILNRGTTDETIPVNFYLSPTRDVDPATRFLLGSTTVSLQYGRSTTGTATVVIPANAPTGYQYLSWVADPNNGISEYYEVNNAVALVQPTLINTNRVPTACFSATPTSGNAPLAVSVNASCTSDPDGTSGLTYAWDFGDGMTGSGPTATNIYMPGYYTITLTVTDPSGASATTFRNISVACKPGSPMCVQPE
jgi:PKD repeat protein